MCLCERSEAIPLFNTFAITYLIFLTALIRYTTIVVIFFLYFAAGFCFTESYTVTRIIKQEKLNATISWTTSSEQGCIGLKLYLSTSEEQNKQHQKLNRDIIPVGGSSYAYTDFFLLTKRTYCYELESVVIKGKAPLSARWA